MKRWLIAVVGLISIMVMVAACARAPEKVITPEEFYRGRTVTWIVPWAPGGGYDTNSRVLAPFLAKEIGAKQILIENMPGGGGYVGMSWLYSSAERDGSVISIMALEKLLFNEMFELGEPVACKSMMEYGWIAEWGGVGGRSVYMVPSARPWKTLSDLKGVSGLKMGVSTAFSIQAMTPLMISKCLGLPDLRMILGYSGSAEPTVATMRGELDLTAEEWDIAASYIAGGLLKPVGTNGRVRMSQYPDLPCLYEVILPGTEKWFDRQEYVSSIFRGLALPPGVPDDRLEFLRAAADRMFHDPEVQEAMIKRGSEIWLERVSVGEHASEGLKPLVDMPQSEKAEFKSSMLALIH